MDGPGRADERIGARRRLFPARAGASTPLGGELHQPTDMYAEVVDGSAWCWARLRSLGALESAPLGPRAVQTMTELGLADLDG